MKYRILGKTGLSVSVLSYGASPLGSAFREVNEADGIRTVHTAIDLGINYIDCSPYYGLTRAETVLGKALKEIPREKYYLATKVGRYGDHDFDFSASRVTRSIDESLSRLNIDYIDIIQCHDIEFGSLDQIVNETIPALRKLQETGKLRFIGITGLPLKIFQYVLDRTEVDTILSYCHFALNDTTLDTLIPYLQEKNVGIVNASALSMGLLTEKGPPAWHPAPPEIREACAKAVGSVLRRGGNPSKIAMQFALANSRIHTTLIGTANPENLQKNVKWMDEAFDLDLHHEMVRVLKPIKNKTWLSGRPENN